MGHPRRAKDAPSPVELLAIFQAKESGVSLPEISRRTKYAISSIIRWYEKWGRDTAFLEAVVCEAPLVARDVTFDVLFPDLDRQSVFEVPGPVEIKEDFKKPLASYSQLVDNSSYSDPDEKLKAYFGVDTLTVLADPTHRHQGESSDEWDE